MSDSLLHLGHVQLHIQEQEPVGQIQLQALHGTPQGQTQLQLQLHVFQPSVEP